MVRDFFHALSCTMITAARQTVGPAVDQEQTIQKTPALCASEEALKRGFIEYNTIFMVRE